MHIEERYTFTDQAKKKVIMTIVAGVVLMVLGIIIMNLFGGSGHEHAHGAEGHGAEAADAHHGAIGWFQRLMANLWLNNVFFIGISVMGTVWVAIQYAAYAGWSAPFKRIPEAMGFFVPVVGIMFPIVFFIGGHDIFHWTHHYLYEVGGPQYDPIIAGKAGYLNTPFYLARMVVFIGLWTLMTFLLRKQSLAEDTNGGHSYFHKSVVLGATFLVIFAVSSSMGAWDWVLSIDTHWFSTMFGWYVFASWWVTAIAVITLAVILLKEKGLLSIVNENHLHDLGKFMFGFSIFWTYIWFSQFVLIWYSNIPEETVYFIERIQNDKYSWILFFNLFVNFVFPFLFLMTRDAKRHQSFLKVASIVLIGGHWMDFYLMIMPGTLKDESGFGFIELGTFLVYGGAFLYVFCTTLAKAPLVPKNHPMLEESVHHHI
jgi:hypothetical protein